ncbi:hypothetical protein L0F51_00130 [Afifella sp. H1R]|uniref:hypothetical protein n=1 Tax=Afifella sp. H1R TaxID=2908841 RepID=UPI001F469F8C|nr:hypothetical protein [Afifella sp. H1R]MCF1502173.1 hypothetical protein [Afifella sp. H1R]
MTETEPRAGHNGFDPQKCQTFVSQIERIFAEMETKKGEYMAWCQGRRELISGVYDNAKDAGIPKKELKANVKRRQLEAQIDALREDMEPDQQDTYDNIRLALGDLADTPLGDAALAKSSAGTGGNAKQEPKDVKPSDADVKAATAKEMAEAPEEVTTSYADRLRKQNDSVDKKLRGSGFPGADAPGSHKVN